MSDEESIRRPAPHKSMEDFFRMDVVTEVISADETTGRVEFKVMPDPRRYDWREEDGKRYLYDRFDQTVIPHDVVMSMLRRAMEMEPRAQPQRLGDALEYVAKRKETIRRRLEDDSADPARADVASSILESHLGERHHYVALVADMVGSTKLARSIDTPDLVRLVRIISDEMSALLPAFYGHVLKFTGDGLIAFFAAPNFITMNDHALDCAMTLRHLVYYGINPALKEWGYREIEIRIGIEAGEGIATAIGSADTKRSVDLVGEFIHMAAKLQGQAPPGAIYIGYINERNLHVGWREQLKPVTMPDTWGFQDDRGNPYPVFVAPDLKKEQQPEPPAG